MTNFLIIFALTGLRICYTGVWPSDFYIFTLKWDVSKTLFHIRFSQPHNLATGLLRRGRRQCWIKNTYGYKDKHILFSIHKRKFEYLKRTLLCQPFSTDDTRRERLQGFNTSFALRILSDGPISLNLYILHSSNSFLFYCIHKESILLRCVLRQRRGLVFLVAVAFVSTPAYSFRFKVHSVFNILPENRTPRTIQTTDTFQKDRLLISRSWSKIYTIFYFRNNFDYSGQKQTKNTVVQSFQSRNTCTLRNV